MQTERKLLVCYGSQTGNAEFLAKRVHALIDKQLPELHPQLQCLKDYTKFALSEFDIAVFVLSSTGEGEPPDNARSFWRFLVRKTQPQDLLARLRFTILGLGDTNYETFQQMPRRLEGRLLELGAKPFYKRGEADDATGLEDVVEPWIGDLMPALKTAVAPSPSAPTEAQTPDAADPQPPAPAADGLTQAMYGLSLLGHPSTPAAADAPPAAAAAAATATTGAPVKKKKIVIRRAPHKEVPDLAPCPFGLTWAEQDEARPRHEPAVPASAPAASPLIRAKLAGARYLSTTDAVRPVLEVELHIPAESGLKWTPGDAFAVLCPNPTHEVTQVIDRLALDGKRVFSLRPVSASSPLPQHVKCPCTVRTALTHFVDLHAVPKKSSLRAFAEYASDPKEKLRSVAVLISFAIDQSPDDRRDQERLLHLSSLKGTDDYRREVLDEGATFLDLLIDYPSLQPPLEEVLDKLPPQQPRYYSHVTSPLASSTSLRFAFSLVRWRSPIKGRDRRGLCTDWLYRLSVGRGFVAPLEGEEERAALDREAEAERKALEREGYEATKDDSEGVSVFARPTRDFVVPDVGASVIMVGAGTGVSPFLGFVQHRELLVAGKAGGSKNDWWLFFGCRNEKKDFLYREDLEGSVERGVLHKLTVAFSRDAEEVVYVQHKMVEHGADIADRLLNANASIYVCGDGAGVVKGVNAAVVEILEKFGGLDPTAAKDRHASLLKDRRLLFDVW